MITRVKKRESALLISVGSTRETVEGNKAEGGYIEKVIGIKRVGEGERVHRERGRGEEGAEEWDGEGRKTTHL